MAIIDDNTTTSLADKGNVNNLKTIDINDSSLPDGKEQEINSSADAWERACPPPDGVYHLALKPGKNCFQMGKTDDGDIYYVANLECKIVDATGDLERWNDTTVFAKVSTYIGAGKEISTMAGMIVKMGVKVPEKCIPKALIQLFAKCLSKEPKLFCQGEWRAWDIPKDEWIKQGMTTFPRTEDGKGYRHVIRDSKGNEVTAKWKPMKWWGNKEYRELLIQQESRKQQSGSNTQVRQQQTQQSKPNGGGAGAGEEVFTEVNAKNPPILQQTQQAKPTAAEEDFVIDE